ncbi:MAG: T9SS type A sorting domain-containing protein [Bacteroidales bacterium]|nr:T9SS type A sorting domain-containing protein [Bacteroidales bacterium]
MNVLGQIIKETEIDGQYIMELPQGIYFVKMGDETRKIVVE